MKYGLLAELQDYLMKFKLANKLDYKEFEKIVCTAANNVTSIAGDKE